MIPSKFIKNQNIFFKLNRLYSKNVLNPSSTLYFTNNNINNNNNNNKINNQKITNSNTICKRFYSSNGPNKNDNNEEDEDDDNDDEKYQNKYLRPLGTDKSQFILEDDVKDLIYDALTLTKNGRSYKSGFGLAANLSLAEFLKSYPPIRNIPKVSPYFYSSNLVKELFQYNPFLLILPHPKTTELSEEFAWNAIKDKKELKLPLNIDKEEFLQNSANALKRIYQLANDGNSLELQQLSCLRATVNLLLLRDTFYTIKNNEDPNKFGFNIDDVDISNFEFKPINARDCEFKKNDEVITIEARYLVTSEKYSLNQEFCPVTIKAQWISPINYFDWRITEIGYSTPFDL
ncbi:hypothetical protein RB653_007839 [Dictyostelium firmibasis]|uniref:Uncharacterized protein n=1 Tax=Dictyostelium firmibasis TaxID=79012 RepID=A0AAN7YY58_9MYCE